MFDIWWQKLCSLLSGVPPAKFDAPGPEAETPGDEEVFQNERGLYGLRGKNGETLLPAVFSKISPLQGVPSAFSVVKSRANHKVELGQYQLANRQLVWLPGSVFELASRDAEERLYAECEKLISEFYREACPCRHPRVRALFDLTRHDLTTRCLDAEVLFSAMSGKLQSLSSESAQGSSVEKMECSVCHATFKIMHEPLSLNDESYQIQCVPSPSAPDVGPPPSYPIPLCRGPVWVGKCSIPSSRFEVTGSRDALMNYLRATGEAGLVGPLCP